MNITVNEDVKYPQCGKGGACKTDGGECGLCMSCVTKNLERSNMKNTHELVKAEVANLIGTEWHRLVEAYQASAYDFNFSIKVNMQGNATVCQITTGLDYHPLPKVKIKVEPVTADEKQIPLPGH